jgi:hypothetical protein
MGITLTILFHQELFIILVIAFRLMPQVVVL